MTERLAIRLLIVGCLALCVVIFVEFRKPIVDGSALESPPPRADPPGTRSPSATPTARELAAQSLMRPLFSATRRPPHEEVKSGEVGLKGVRLTGILTSPNDAIAIFAMPEGRPRNLRTGDKLDDWEVERIETSSVSLAGPEGTVTFEPKPAPPGSVRTSVSTATMAPRTAPPAQPPAAATRGTAGAAQQGALGRQQTGGPPQPPNASSTIRPSVPASSRQ
jgi:hypothetical protein